MILIKHTIITITIACIFQTVAWGQNINDDITLGLKNANIELITSHIDKNIELTIDGKDNIYSINQAKVVLKDFFDNHKPTEFTIGHVSSTYIIGTLTTENNTYRIFWYLQTKQNTTYIQKLSFTLDE